MGLRRGTHNYAEQNNLRHLLIFALEKICNRIQIFGDSNIVINWFKSTSHFHVHTHRGLMDEVITLKSHFDWILCLHIYRERNKISNDLYKEVAQQLRGQWIIQEHYEHEIYQFFHSSFIEHDGGGAQNYLP